MDRKQTLSSVGNAFATIVAQCFAPRMPSPPGLRRISLTAPFGKKHRHGRTLSSDERLACLLCLHPPVETYFYWAPKKMK